MASGVTIVALPSAAVTSTLGVYCVVPVMLVKAVPVKVMAASAPAVTVVTLMPASEGIIAPVPGALAPLSGEKPWQPHQSLSPLGFAGLSLPMWPQYASSPPTTMVPVGDLGESAWMLWSDS